MKKIIGIRTTIKTHIIGILLVIMALSYLSGCAMPPAQQVMPPISCAPSAIDFHLDKDIDLIWQTGDVIAADGGHALPMSNDLIANLTIATIDSIQSKTDPSRFSYSYGRSQQVVFMTSLQHNLEQADAFRSVNLIAGESVANPQHAKIIVHFVKTRVGSQGEAFPIYLTVSLKIINEKRSLIKNFFIYSTNPIGFFSSPSFIQQQTDVSTQLMNNIIYALRSWVNSY